MEGAIWRNPIIGPSVSSIRRNHTLSERNVEIVRRAFAEFASSQRLSSDHAPDFVWNLGTFPGWPDKREYVGREEFYEFFRAWTEPYEDWSLTTEKILDTGADQVVCVLSQSARPRGSGSSVELHYAAVYTVTDGQIRRIDLYESAEQALAAVGVSESL
jgi:ketosteroid isomerase-like protein